MQFSQLSNMLSSDLNLLAWSEQNMVVLGLASSVCIWNASTQSLQGSLRLTPHTSDLFGPSSCPLVSSVAWSKDGQTLAIGKSDGEILVNLSLKSQAAWNCLLSI